MTMITATDLHLETIRAARMDDLASEMRDNGVTMTWDQADTLDDRHHDWLRNRLGLVSETSSFGIDYTPRPETVADETEA